MTQQPVARKTIRQWSKSASLNNAGHDFHTSTGTRISLPLSIDPPISLRKEWLNAIRSMTASMTSSVSSPSMSGLSVESASNNTSDVESYLAMSIDTLRTAVLFQRGGLPMDLVLKLQHITGIEAISDKEIATAFKNRQATVKSYISENPFDHELGS